MPSAKQLERILLDLSLDSRAVWDVRSGCRHSCSVVICHALRINTSTSACTSTYHQREEPHGSHVGDGESGPSSAAGASDKSLPTTPAGSAPAPAAPGPAPAAPGGPAVTTIDNGSDEDDSGPKAFSNTTGQSTPVTQQAEMTGSSRVPRVPQAEMTESSRVPRVLKAEMTKSSRVPRVSETEIAESSRVPRYQELK